MSTFPAHAPTQGRAMRALAFVGPFHLRMVLVMSILLAVSLAGCALTGIEITGLGAWAILILVMLAMVSPVLGYWYEKGRADLLDSSLTVFWAFLLRVIIPLLVRVGARLRM